MIGRKELDQLKESNAKRLTLFYLRVVNLE